MKASPKGSSYRIRIDNLLAFINFTADAKCSLVDQSLIIKKEEKFSKESDNLINRIKGLTFSKNGRRVFIIDDSDKSVIRVIYNDVIPSEEFNLIRVRLDSSKKTWLRDLVDPIHMRFSGSHDENGILIMHGPKFNHGITIENATFFDIAL